MKRFSVLACVGLFMVGGAGVRAQQPKDLVAQGAAAAQEARDRDLARIVPVKVKIVLSKYQAEKKVSSLPYELTVRSDGRNASIRMGADVAIPQSKFTPAPTPAAKPGEVTAGGPPAMQSFTYRNLGTNIDCTVSNLDPGRFAVTLTIEDTSIYPDDTANTSAQSRAPLPTFRTFRSTSDLVLRDGQSTEFTAATDKVSGEVTKAEVTLTVVK